MENLDQDHEPEGCGGSVLATHAEIGAVSGSSVPNQAPLKPALGEDGDSMMDNEGQRSDKKSLDASLGSRGRFREDAPAMPSSVSARTFIP